MKILMTGATGFLGSRLGEVLFKKGHDLVVLSRNAQRAKAVLPFPAEVYDWKIETPPPREAFTGVEAIINLHGETISKRWDKDTKKAIYDSRVIGTRNLVAGWKESGAKIQAFLSASAIGIYGNRVDEELDEHSSIAGDFLATVCRDWESEAKSSPHCRQVLLRIGVILGATGGMVQKLVPVFRNGGGGRLASGEQWLSWIHVDDAVAAIEFALENPACEGAINLVAPNSTKNADFTVNFAESLRTKAWLPAPKFALKLALGEMASFILASARVLPKKLLSQGFVFKYPYLPMALNEIMSSHFFHGELACNSLVRKQWVQASVDDVFNYFSNEMNLEKLTPPWLSFRVLGKNTSKIEEGTLIDYQLKLHGVPMNWRTRIDAWHPQTKFVDEQLKGPYKLWHHTHRFQAVRQGTWMTDEVKYILPLGKLGQWSAGSFVEKDVGKIFDYRRKVISEIFPARI